MPDGLPVGEIRLQLWLADSGEPIVTTTVEPDDAQAFPLLSQLGMMVLGMDTLIRPPDSTGDPE